MKYRITVAVMLLLLCIVSLSSAQETGNTVELGLTNDGIPTLVDPAGMTLYTFEHDEDGVSTCYEGCDAEWPPYTIDASAQPTVGGGIPGEIGTTTREDGSIQVTYRNEPLYFFYLDEAPGDANGHGFEDVWFAANPATVMLGGNEELGNFLVGPGGLTLYLFTEDEGGESYCYDECAREWPPLLVRDGEQPTAGEGAAGTLAMIEREDGSSQVTYNGIPLYFYHEDEAPGDALGDGSEGVWFVALPEGQEPIPGDE